MVKRNERALINERRAANGFEWAEGVDEVLRHTACMHASVRACRCVQHAGAVPEELYAAVQGALLAGALAQPFLGLRCLGVP